MSPHPSKKTLFMSWQVKLAVSITVPRKTLTNCFSSTRSLVREADVKSQRELTNMINTLLASSWDSIWALIIRFVPSEAIG